MPQDEGTPLHAAAITGRAAVVEKLLAAGADTEAKNYVRMAEGTGDADREGLGGAKRSVACYPLCGEPAYTPYRKALGPA